jgi:hypothetical protein
MQISLDGDCLELARDEEYGAMRMSLTILLGKDEPRD